MHVASAQQYVLLYSDLFPLSSCNQLSDPELQQAGISSGCKFCQLNSSSQHLGPSRIQSRLCAGHKYAAEEASLVGNTCLYGATGGRLFVNGRAGERFAVRNSMAQV